MDDKLPSSQPPQQGPLGQISSSEPLPPPKIEHGWDLLPKEAHLHQDKAKEDTLPSPIHVTKVDKYSEKNDPPLIDMKVANPVTYLKNWLNRLLKNEGIDIGFKFRVRPFTAIAIMIALAASFGTGYGTGLNAAAGVLFPNSSPILNRSVMYQGMVQKTVGGKYVLTLPNSDLYTLKPKNNTSISFQNINDGPALVKGNLTREAFVIDVSEIIPLGVAAEVIPTPVPSDPSNTPTDIDLTKIYPGLEWEINQKKILIFTSGKRKIEQEGIYLESTLIPNFPQDFFNFYTLQLKDKSFKETLNSINPERITATYARDNLFLTFGVKNIYSGSGDKKQLTGYKAFIEHN